MYLLHLTRRQLQSRCKQAGIRANTSNKAMAEALKKHELAKACAAHAMELDGRQEDGAVLAAGTEEVLDSSEAGSQMEELCIQKFETVKDRSSEVAPESSSLDEGDKSNDSEVSLPNAPELPPDHQSPSPDSHCQKKERAIGPSEAPPPKEEEKVDRPAVKCSLEGQGFGNLAQELLAKERASCALGVSAHREPFKRNVIGQTGKGVRQKRAAEKGSLERGTLVAQKRGVDLVKGNESGGAGAKTATTVAGPGSKYRLPALPLAQTETGSGLECEKKGSNDEKGEYRPAVVQLADTRAPVGEPESTDNEKDGEVKAFDTQDAPGKDPSLNEDSFEGDKENIPYEVSTDTVAVAVKASDIPLAQLERPVLLPEDTLVGSLLGDEKRVSSGQAAHRECYKSRPFSAKGVERRALAAAKKSMGKREAILAEKRNLKLYA